MTNKVSDQPTNDELHAAWTDAISAVIGRSGALHELQLLREKRTTWYGESELDLRKAIDNYLEGTLP